MMTCEQARLKASALIDSEIEEDEVTPLISHLESCYRCRNEYISLLRVQKRLKAVEIREPPREWFERFPEKWGRRFSGFLGRAIFIGSYVLLCGYALYHLFSSPDATLLLKLIVWASVAGFVLLLGVSIADRIRESRDDRYKGVMK